MPVMLVYSCHAAAAAAVAADVDAATVAGAAAPAAKAALGLWAATSRTEERSMQQALYHRIMMLWRTLLSTILP